MESVCRFTGWQLVPTVHHALAVLEPDLSLSELGCGEC